MKALTAAGVLYEVQVYPDNNHNLAGFATTTHVYHTMTRYVTFSRPSRHLQSRTGGV